MEANRILALMAGSNLDIWAAIYGLRGTPSHDVSHMTFYTFPMIDPTDESKKGRSAPWERALVNSKMYAVEVAI